MFPICLISLAGLLASSWGSQFYMTCIEALLFLIALIIITVIEFKTAKMYGYNKIAEEIPDSFAIPLENKEEIERNLRRDALKGIINRWLGKNDMFDTNRIEK
jgi:hypothetical protein